MSQRNRETSNPTDVSPAADRTPAPDAPHGRLKSLDEQPAASRGTAHLPSTAGNPPDQHTGYAEMDSRQRQRWNEAGAALDPEQAVWGSNEESQHASEDQADEEHHPSSPERPQTGASPAVRPKARKA